MKKRTSLTAARLRELLRYDAATGVFYWREIGRGRRLDLRAGTCESGYVNICVDWVVYRAHRLAWLYVTGKWPKEQIDHKNRVRDDNRFVNLREATNGENGQNQGRARSNNKSSGLLGVTWHKQRGRWKSGLQLNGKHHHVGLFDTPEEAHFAYLKAKRDFHPYGEIARR